MKLSCKTIEKKRSKSDNHDQIIWTKHPIFKGWKDSNEIFYKKFFYALEIIKVELTNRYLNDFLAYDLELKRSIDWPKRLLIIMMFESLQHNIKAYVKRL